MHQALATIFAQFGLTSHAPDALQALDVGRRAQLLAALQAGATELAEGATDDDLAALHEVVAAVEAVDATVPPSAVQAPAQRPVTATRVRRPASTLPRPSVHASPITAAGGRPIAANDVAAEMATALDQLSRGIVTASFAPRGRVLVASVASNGAWPRLGADSAANATTITAAVAAHQAALVASGGICGPVPALHDYPNVRATTARPIRNALVRLEGDRGGVRLIPPPSLADVAAGITVWTEANDQNPVAPATKGIVTMDCPTEVEVLVHAVVQRLRFGNFRGRFQPEQVAQWLDVLAVAHARTAEQELLDAIDAGSTATNAGQVLGAARDVLAVLDRAGAQYRDRQRLDDEAFLLAILPSWLRSAMRTDFTRQLPGDNAAAMTNAQVDQLFTARQISPVWALDAEPLTATQGDGAPLNGWPSTVTLRLFAPGTWAFIDGGALNLGVVRDPELNQTNDAETFAETFEAAVQLGLDSVAIEAAVCPDGSTSSTVDLVGICETGS